MAKLVGETKLTRHVTAFLLRRGVEPEESVDKDELPRLHRYEVSRKAGIRGSLYVRPPKRSPPSWLDFVEPAIDDDLRLWVASSSALLFVHTKEHWFAVAFGFGRHLLNADAIDEGFGLRVTLNLVDPERLRSVDLKTIDDVTLHTRRQASRTSAFDAFGVDVVRDILRAVTGQPRDTALALGLTGADALAFHAPMVIADLPGKLSQFLDAYDRNDYKDRFAWIDHISVVRDQVLHVQLDERVVQAIRTGEVGGLYLAAPEPLDWENIAGFRYEFDREDRLFADVDYDDYRALRPDVADPEYVLKKLKSDRVAVISSQADQRIARWSLYRCIAFETEFAHQTFVLSGGSWYRVDLSFAAEVKADIDSLPESELSFPDATLMERESEYLTRAAPLMCASCRMHIALMDQKLARAEQAADRIEVCDLMSELGHFVHVKRRTRSSTLSHLFAQGLVSADAFVSDARFRAEARAHVTGSPCDRDELFPDGAIDHSIYTVVYGVITPRRVKLQDQLPFFSRVNLSHAARRLRSLGVGVELKCIGLA